MEPDSTPSSRYATVVIDPPWDIAPWGFSAHEYAEALPYRTLSTDEIANLPLARFFADDALVFVWTVNKRLQDAFRLLDAWGLAYAFTMTWVKTKGPQAPGTPCFNAEWILVGRRGSLAFRDTRAFSTANVWPSGAHSEKPEQFYDLLRRVTPGPRLDVFGRRKISGFDSWGDQAPDVVGSDDGEYQDVLF